MHRDLLITIVIFGLLPVCFARPWIGVLVWYWIGYMNPHRLTWGFAYNMPFSLMVAMATIIGILITRERSPLPRSREVQLLILLWIIFLVSTIFATYPNEAWRQLEKVSKILLMTFVTLILFQDKRKLRVLLLITAVSLGFFGFKGGIWATLAGGQYQLHGPPGSFIEGNTNLGLALNMMLPIFLFFGRNETRKWLRLLFLSMFLLSIASILITYSRGAFLGLLVVVGMLLVKSRQKVIGVFLLAGGIMVTISLLPGMWVERMRSIDSYQEDRSSMARIRAWQVSYELALDHPIFGGGFETFSPEIYKRYLSAELLATADVGTGAHSIFFQILGEHGFAGLLLYVSLIASTMFSLHKTGKACGKAPDMKWIQGCASMVEVSMLGYAASGVFLSMCYFDLFYQLVAITILLRCLVLQRAKQH